jgi:predicted amidohydrolase
MLICHEWRYPELYREYYLLQAKVIFQSWYDGNQSLEKYQKEGKHLGELIMGAARGYAANNNLWISGSNTSRKESSFPCFVIRPDGKILNKPGRNRAGIVLSRIDTNKKFHDPSAHLRDDLLRKKYR